MSEFKGTKGPWVVNQEKEGMITSGTQSIASTWSQNVDDLDKRLEGESWLDMRERTKEEREIRVRLIPKANALLISKAPEMLEMLEEMLFVLKREEGYDEMYKEVRDLIKSATEL